MNMQMYQALTLLWSALLQLMGRRAPKTTAHTPKQDGGECVRQSPSHVPPGGETRPSSAWSSLVNTVHIVNKQVINR